MSESYQRFVILSALSAIVGICLAIVNLAEQPHFDRVAIEFVLCLPFALFLLGRRLRLRH